MEPRAPLPNSAAAPRALVPPAVVFPSPGTAPLATPVPTIVTLCEDQALLQAVTVAAAEQAAVINSPTPDRFIDQLVANGAEVAVIDGTTAPIVMTSFLTGLRRQFPQLRVLVAGTAMLYEELRAQIADGTVFRFAHKPTSAKRLKLLLMAALGAHPPAPPAADGVTARAAVPSAAPATATAPGADPGATDTASATGAVGESADETREAIAAAPRTRPRWLWPLLLCLVTCAAMLVGWYASSLASRWRLLP